MEEAALGRKKQIRRSRERKLDGEGEARVIALPCSDSPEGCDRWTLELSADELVRLQCLRNVHEQHTITSSGCPKV